MNNNRFLGLRTAVYKVPNLQKAKEWYTKAFKTKPYFDELFYVGFNIKGYELGLMPVEEKDQKRGDNSLSYWGVENIQEVYDHLIDLGAKEHEKPTNVGGELITASVLDPWGNVIGIIFNPYFKLP
jgi:predicted enzyme related to lactoylglutathione lyase